MIAQDFERKGLAEAIAGVAASTDERLALVVVGKPEPGAYRELARRAGVADRVIFAGPTIDPYLFYAAADFFVLPTRHDPCSLVVLEALAMGLPVISTRQNGACEIMTPGEHGFVLENADDATGLVAAMRALCDGAARARMRANCLALRPRLAYDAHMDALLRVYSSIIAASGNP
jgi:UDP-glucose:(heptosyl)LPS alpha-1,3-glucosyltransferase